MSEIEARYAPTAKNQKTEKEKNAQKNTQTANETSTTTRHQKGTENTGKQIADRIQV